MADHKGVYIWKTSSYLSVTRMFLLIDQPIRHHNL